MKIIFLPGQISLWIGSRRLSRRYGNYFLSGFQFRQPFNRPVFFCRFWTNISFPKSGRHSLNLLYSSSTRYLTTANLRASDGLNVSIGTCFLFSSLSLDIFLLSNKHRSPIRNFFVRWGMLSLTTLIAQRTRYLKFFYKFFGQEPIWLFLPKDRKNFNFNLLSASPLLHPLNRCF